MQAIHYHLHGDPRKTYIINSKIDARNIVYAMVDMWHSYFADLYMRWSTCGIHILHNSTTHGRNHMSYFAEGAFLALFLKLFWQVDNKLGAFAELFAIRQQWNLDIEFFRIGCHAHDHRHLLDI